METTLKGRITKVYLSTRSTGATYFLLHCNKQNKTYHINFKKAEAKIFSKVVEWNNRVVEAVVQTFPGVSIEHNSNLISIKRVVVDGNKNPNSPQQVSSLVENSTTLYYSAHAKERIRQREAALTIEQTRKLERIVQKALTYKHKDILVFVEQRYVYAIIPQSNVVTTVMNIGMLRWEDGMIDTSTVDSLYFID